MTKELQDFSYLLQKFFTQRLMQQRQASSHTIASYRDTFRLLLKFTGDRVGKSPSQLRLQDIDAPLVAAFLEELEKGRGISPRTRNLRLTAIRAFFRFVAFEAPDQAFQIQRILAIPSKKYTKTIVTFLTREEIEALLSVPDRKTWSGRRDYALILVAVQTGLRLSELTSLNLGNIKFDQGTYIRVVGKGRKERSIPLTKVTASVLQDWIEDVAQSRSEVLFPNARGARLSADGVQYLLSKHVSIASTTCPTLKNKRVTPHVLRHTMAMELLQAGVDQSVIALWLGHESIETTQIYLHASLEFKQKILDKTMLSEGTPGRYRPDDQLMAFLQSL